MKWTILFWFQLQQVQMLFDLGMLFSSPGCVKLVTLFCLFAYLQRTLLKISITLFVGNFTVFKHLTF